MGWGLGVYDHKTNTYRISWGELREAWEYLVRTRDYSKFDHEGNRREAKELMESWERSSDFHGYKTHTDVNKWLAEGYQPETDTEVETFPTHKKRRRLRSTEEGEYQHDQMLSGADYPFLAWDSRMRKGGVYIRCDTTMSAWTKAKVIEDYLEYIASLMRTLEQDGIDCAVAIWITTKNMYDNSGTKENEHVENVEIIVKRENEATDFTQWSPMISPAAFRGFGFLVCILGADAKGTRCCGTYGQCYNPPKWTVDYNSDTKELTFRPPTSANEFPVDKIREDTRKLLHDIEHY